MERASPVSPTPTPLPHDVKRVRHCLLNISPNDMVLMSNENMSAADFWNEFEHGRGGQSPLRELEEEGKAWRSDLRLDETHPSYKQGKGGKVSILIIVGSLA